MTNSTSGSTRTFSALLLLFHARASNRSRSCVQLVRRNKWARPQEQTGRRMGVGLKLRKLSFGYYAIAGLDSGMAAHSSSKLHEGDWLQAIDGQSVLETALRSGARRCSRCGQTPLTRVISIVEDRLEGMYDSTVEVCYWSAADAAVSAAEAAGAFDVLRYALLPVLVAGLLFH